VRREDRGSAPRRASGIESALPREMREGTKTEGVGEKEGRAPVFSRESTGPEERGTSLQSGHFCVGER